jgi:hypothetical protein
MDVKAFPASCGILVMTDLGYTNNQYGLLNTPEKFKGQFQTPSKKEFQQELRQHEYMHNERGIYLMSLNTKQIAAGMAEWIIEAGYSEYAKALNGNSGGNIWLYGKVNKKFKEPKSGTL